MKTEDIWNRYSARLFSFIRKRVNDTDVAEDLLQDIFIRIHSKLHTLKCSSKLESWLYQITRRVVTDYYRARSRTEDLPEQLTLLRQTGGESVSTGLLPCIESILLRLPDKYRSALWLSSIEGKTQKEIAAEKGISHSGAKSQVQRGRMQLKTLLEQCCEIEFNRNSQMVHYRVKDRSCKLC